MSSESERALEALDPAEAVGLLQELIRIPSVNPPGNEGGVAEALARVFAADGIPVEIDRFAPSRANVVARLRGGGNASLVLSGHLDTVPPGETAWDRDPFSGDLAGGRVWGRGAADMKSGLAAMVMAMRLLARAHVSPPGDVILAGSAGEEVDCCGAARLLNRGVLKGAGGLVVGEPTGGVVASAHRGALWVELTTLGKTAHGSMPAEGINAVMHMHAVLSRVAHLDISRPPDPLLGRPTLAVTTVHGGVNVNVIPDRCVVTLDIRTIPGQAHAEILTQIRSEVDGVRRSIPDLRADIRVLTDRPSVQTDPAHPFVEAALSAARGDGASGRPRPAPVGMPYFSDASVYVPPTRVPAVFYGPGEAALAHRPNEWVDRDEYLAAICCYIRMAMSKVGV